MATSTDKGKRIMIIEPVRAMTSNEVLLAIAFIVLMVAPEVCTIIRELCKGK